MEIEIQNQIISLLSSINEQIYILTTFFQFFVYGFIVVLIVYFGYWFFSRFFY